MEKEMTKFYQCDCGCSILTINIGVSDNWPWVNVAMWMQAGFDIPWRGRIRMAWYILRHGQPFGDDIMLDQHTVEQMVADLSAIDWPK